MVQESQKKAARKWDGENMSTLGCKVKKAQAESFKAYCAGQGKTSNAVLRDYVLDCIGETESPVKAPERPQEGHFSSPPSITEKARKAATEAAEATGEALEAFVERAVVTQAERDKRSWRMGIDPVTGKKAGE